MLPTWVAYQNLCCWAVNSSCLFFKSKLNRFSLNLFFSRWLYNLQWRKAASTWRDINLSRSSQLALLHTQKIAVSGSKMIALACLNTVCINEKVQKDIHQRQKRYKEPISCSGDSSFFLCELVNSCKKWKRLNSSCCFVLRLWPKCWGENSGAKAQAHVTFSII